MHGRHPHLRTAVVAFPMPGASPAAQSTTAAPPRPGHSADDEPTPPAPPDARQPGRPGTVPMFTAIGSPQEEQEEPVRVVTSEARGLWRDG
jgi:hypothetical protein